jgi:hypothetical protein
MASSSNPTEQTEGEGRQPIVVNVYLTPSEQEYMPPRLQRTTTLTPGTTARMRPTQICDCLCGSQSGGGSGS